MYGLEPGSGLSVLLDWLARPYEPDRVTAALLGLVAGGQHHAHELARDAAGQAQEGGGDLLGIVRAHQALEDPGQTRAGLDAVHRRQTGSAVPSTSPMVRRASARSVSSSSSAIDW